MNTVAAPLTTIGVTVPTQPASAIQQTREREEGAGQNQNRVGVSGQPQGGVAGAGTTTTVQDSRQVTAGKESQEKQQPKKEEVEKAVSSVNEYISKLRSRELQFSVDEDSGKMVIKIVDTDNKKVLRQIPPEDMLRLADNIGKDKGWLVEQKA